MAASPKCSSRKKRRRKLSGRSRRSGGTTRSRGRLAGNFGRSAGFHGHGRMRWFAGCRGNWMRNRKRRTSRNNQLESLPHPFETQLAHVHVETVSAKNARHTGQHERQVIHDERRIDEI